MTSDNGQRNGDDSPLIRERAEHTISRKQIDPYALKVLYRLHNAGYIAYLVGGGVRDLLLGISPKDFDVATDASPSQVKRLFRNCFIIGRRFRLAHIRYGDTCIETSTFRKAPESDAEEEDILIRSDNTFGTPEEDALRRDFTINSLFYDIATFQVIDFVGGLSDLDNRLVRAIGDPRTRFREDPVRMLRAIRFAARLGFVIEEETERALCACVPEIDKAAPARLYEEVLKLYKFGAAEAAFRRLHACGILRHLFPAVAAWHDGATPEQADHAWALLRELDERNRDNGLQDPAFLFGAVLYPMLSDVLVRDMPFPELMHCIREVAVLSAERLNVPKQGHFTHTLSTLFLLQWQLRHERKGRRLRRMPQEEPFAHALTLYRMHENVWGVEPSSRLLAWERFVVLREEGMGVDEALVEAGLIDRANISARISGRRSRRVKRPAVAATSAAGAGDDVDATDDADGADDAPDLDDAAMSDGDSDEQPDAPRRAKRSRRRRRRKPRNAGESAASSGEASASTPVLAEDWSFVDEAPVQPVSDEETSMPDEDAPAVEAEVAADTPQPARRRSRRRRRKPAAKRAAASGDAFDQDWALSDSPVGEDGAAGGDGTSAGEADEFDFSDPVDTADAADAEGDGETGDGESDSDVQAQPGKRPRRRRRRSKSRLPIIPLASEAAAGEAVETGEDGDFSPPIADDGEDPFESPHWLDEV